MPKIFRNDDVNPNSDFNAIRKMYSTIKRYYPDAIIYSAVTILAQTSNNGSAYKGIKIPEIDFHSCDKVFDFDELEGLENVVSHGMCHFDHKNISEDLQTMSVLDSCLILKTKIFVPPFLRVSKYLLELCKQHNIQVLGLEDGWCSLDRGRIEKACDVYVFHSWRHTPEEFEEKFK